jgi:hypothetical protein
MFFLKAILMRNDGGYKWREVAGVIVDGVVFIVGAKWERITTKIESSALCDDARQHHSSNTLPSTTAALTTTQLSHHLSDTTSFTQMEGQ